MRTVENSFSFYLRPFLRVPASAAWLWLALVEVMSKFRPPSSGSVEVVHGFLHTSAFESGVEFDDLLTFIARFLLVAGFLVGHRDLIVEGGILRHCLDRSFQQVNSGLRKPFLHVGQCQGIGD